jgi:DNA-binding NarL/FixJ family response regulator
MNTSSEFIAEQEAADEFVGRLPNRPPQPGRRARSPSSRSANPKCLFVLVAQGLSNAEIASQLYISLFTAKTHVSRILTKLNARDRAQLVMHAYETGLVTPGN